MKDEVLEFIQKRFINTFNWTTTNCYYFAVILQNRFSDGKIFFDVRKKHFVFYYNEQYYDWNGIYECNENYVLPWDVFEIHDAELKEKIVNDFIM